MKTLIAIAACAAAPFAVAAERAIEKEIVVKAPVHDAWSFDTVDAKQRAAAMGNQRIDERALPIAGRRMDDEIGRLVDDDDVGVFINDIERDRFALRYGGTRRHLEREAFAGLDLAACVVGGFVVLKQPLVRHQRLHARAAHLQQ